MSISCPNISGQDFGFTLYKDGEVICNYLYNFGSPTTNCTMNMSMDVRLKRGNNSSTFILNGVTAAQYGIYRCEGNVMYPPPYVSDYTALGKLVLVDGKNSKELQSVILFKYNKYIEYL